MFTENANVCFNPASETVRFSRNWEHYLIPTLLSLLGQFNYHCWLHFLCSLSSLPYPRQTKALPLNPHLLWASLGSFSQPQVTVKLKTSFIFLPPQSPMSNQEESSQWSHNNITNFPLFLPISFTRMLAQQLTFCHLACPQPSRNPRKLLAILLSIHPFEHWEFNHLWSYLFSVQNPSMAPFAYWALHRPRCWDTPQELI